MNEWVSAKSKITASMTYIEDSCSLEANIELA